MKELFIQSSPHILSPCLATMFGRFFLWKIDYGFLHLYILYYAKLFIYKFVSK